MFSGVGIGSDGGPRSDRILPHRAIRPRAPGASWLAGRAGRFGPGGETLLDALQCGFDADPVVQRLRFLQRDDRAAQQRQRVAARLVGGISPHHSSAIIFKRNQLVGSFVPSRWLARDVFAKLVQDYLVFGDCFGVKVRSLSGATMRIDYSPAKYTRRGIEAGRWFYVPGATAEREFDRDSVVQLMQPDVNQEIYGVPEYLSALQSALLNEAATLFRRRYYLNGSHAGYIMYATGDIDVNDTDALKAAMKGSKGPGNFRSMFVHAPNGKENSIKIIPIAEAAAKDEFLGIKSATQADVMAAHRVPPQLLGIVPAQGSAFGRGDQRRVGRHRDLLSRVAAPLCVFSRHAAVPDREPQRV